ncbi:uncharacterized protein B0I36DRAFT_110998 [Microdochium trichocladiopsis]|uniref:Uncharacterized protein n=1 Tax=Microdochium trichocladiopsis TaxID=1682393 RepID=A0A9P8Y7J4_9PEZI|nr:uncharacterized protein B0I36DRAFT_110998 [Microdochium trichocladiopsis]KAH7033630.1 hypothetical protein B0I36DRAFT_110998 [Microdochium trichocladiopsis]
MATSSWRRTIQWKILLAVGVLGTLWPFLALIVIVAAGRVRIGSGQSSDADGGNGNSPSPSSTSPYLIFSSLALLHFGGILPARKSADGKLIHEYQVKMHYFPYAFGYEWPRSWTRSGATGIIRAENRMGLFAFGTSLELPKDLMAVGRSMDLRPQDYLCLDDAYVKRWSSNSTEVRTKAREWPAEHHPRGTNSTSRQDLTTADRVVQEAMETDNLWAEWVRSVRHDIPSPLCTNTFFDMYSRIEPKHYLHRSFSNPMPLLLLLFIEYNLVSALFSHIRRSFLAPLMARGARRSLKVKRATLGVDECICPHGIQKQQICLCTPGPLAEDPNHPTTSAAALVRGDVPRRHMPATFLIHILATLVMLLKAWSLKRHVDMLDKALGAGGMRATYGSGFILFRFGVLVVAQLSRACWDKLATMDKEEYELWAVRHEVVREDKKTS